MVHRAAPAPASPPAPAGPPYPVAHQVIRLVDTTRTVRLPGIGRVARPLVTDLWFPLLSATAAAGGTSTLGQSGTRFPLVVFGHGFAVRPSTYVHLLRAWARAGYVVAAPAFPLGNAGAPGGPDESDLPNQPGDVSFVISRLLHAARRERTAPAALIDPLHVAVAGQSDGGDTALAVADDRRFADRRVGAAAILSGAEIPMLPAFRIAPGGPPLLAVQGTADTINPPSLTHQFYDGAPPPKFLLTLIGAGHLPPYTSGQPQLAIVERVTIAFFDRYLKHDPTAARRMLAAARRPGTAVLDSHS